MNTNTLFLINYFIIQGYIYMLILQVKTNVHTAVPGVQRTTWIQFHFDCCIPLYSVWSPYKVYTIDFPQTSPEKDIYRIIS